MIFWTNFPSCYCCCCCCCCCWWWCWCVFARLFSVLCHVFFDFMFVVFGVWFCNVFFVLFLFFFVFLVLWLVFCVLFLFFFVFPVLWFVFLVCFLFVFFLFYLSFFAILSYCLNSFHNCSTWIQFTGPYLTTLADNDPFPTLRVWQQAAKVKSWKYRSQ